MDLCSWEISTYKSKVCMQWIPHLKIQTYRTAFFYHSCNRRVRSTHSSATATNLSIIPSGNPTGSPSGIDVWERIRTPLGNWLSRSDSRSETWTNRRAKHESQTAC